MGVGKSSGSQSTQLTPEQTQALQAQTNFLTNTIFPAYQNTISGAQNVYNQVNPNATNAANNAINVASQTGQLQQGVGNSALTGGTAGQQQLAAYQQALGQGLTGTGANSLGNTANYQAQTGQQLQNQGANTISTLFSPQYEQQQIQGALQSGYQSALDAQNGQNAMYGGAGGLGSSREALADENLQSLTAQRQEQAAANAMNGVQQNQLSAANSLLGAGTSNLGAANSAYGQILGAGQTANNAAQTGYSTLAGQGTANLAGANQAAGANIGYAQTPQNTYSNYASTIFGVPTANTTPNFSGTQSSTSSGKGKSLGGK